MKNSIVANISLAKTTTQIRSNILTRTIVSMRIKIDPRSKTKTDHEQNIAHNPKAGGNICNQ